MALQVAQRIESICLAHTNQKMFIDCNKLVSSLKPAIFCRQSLGEDPLDHNGKFGTRGGPSPTNNTDPEATPLRVPAKLNLNQSVGEG